MGNENKPTEPEIVEMPKPYKVRSDGAVLLTEEVLAMVRWKPGDDVMFTVDVTNRKITIGSPNGECSKVN